MEIVEDFERCGPALMDPFMRDYVWGAAGRQTTMFENKEAYKRIWMKKRVLTGTSAKCSLKTTVFGRQIELPLGIAPTVGHSIFHKEGEIGMASAASKMGAIMILNGYSLTSLEDVANSVPRHTELWIQTYVFRKRELTSQLVQRAERAGYKAIVVTVDEPFDTDVRCKSRSTFFNRYISGKCHNILQANSNTTSIDDTITFKELAWVVKLTKLPVICKGILTAEDALQCVEAGAKGIYVSNQGGRELEWSLPTIDALPAIVKAVRPLYPQVEIYIDGGIRTGHDIYKALARGAKAAFIGRPAIWGLVMGGEKGVSTVLKLLRQEFREAMIHSGFSSTSSIAYESLISKWIYTDF